MTSKSGPRRLDDPHACPSCAAPLVGSDACTTCGLPLRHPLTGQLWQVSLQASALLRHREQLLLQLRAAATDQRTVPTAQHAASPSPGAAPSAAPASPGASAGDVSGVRRVLVGLGVLLLAIAAVIFTAVAWGRLGIGGRAAVLAVLTAAAAAGAVLARRARLTTTAEGLAALTVILLLLDAYAVRRLGVLGADLPSGPAYVAGTLAVVALLSWLAWRAVPLASWVYTAAVAAQLPVPVLISTLRPLLVSALLIAQALIVTVVARRATRGRAPTAVAGLLLGGAGLAWLLGVGGAADRGYAGDGLPGPLAVLAAASLVGGLAVRLLPERWGPPTGAGAAAFALVLGLHVAIAGPLGDSGQAVLLTAVGCALAAAVRLARSRAWWAGPVLVALVTGLWAVTVVAEPTLAAVGGPLSWLDATWSTQGLGGSRALLSAYGSGWTGDLAVPTTLALLAALAVLATLAVPARRAATPAGAAPPARSAAPFLRLATSAGRWIGAGLLTLAVAVLPLALDAPYRVAMLTDVVMGAAALAASAALGAHRNRSSVWSPTLAAGGGLALLGLAWSAAHRGSTLVALAVLLVGAAAGAAFGAPPRRSLLAAVATLCAAGLVATAVSAAGGGAAPAGFAAVVVGGLLAVAGTWRLRNRIDRAAVESAGGAAALAGLVATAAGGDPGWTAHALVAGGVAAAAVAVRADRRPAAGWLSGLLLVAASWVRLADASVTAPEPYTVPPALTLLALGVWRYRREPTTSSSWAAFGPGLALGLLPALLAALGDQGLARPLLLGLIALLVTLVGARARLQAPLLIGGSVLAIDALAQLAPYAAAVPRWVSVGAAGLLLLAVGTTYEDRLRDLRRARRGLGRLG